MPRRCELTGIRAQTGNNVSHSNRKTKRRFRPNVQRVHLHERRARPQRRAPRHDARPAHRAEGRRPRRLPARHRRREAPARGACPQAKRSARVAVARLHARGQRSFASARLRRLRLAARFACVGGRGRARSRASSTGGRFLASVRFSSEAPMHIDPRLFSQDAIDPSTRAANETAREAARAAAVVRHANARADSRCAAGGREHVSPAGAAAARREPAHPRARGRDPPRIFRPEKPRGVYLHIHGGGWALGAEDQQDQMLDAVAKRTGLVAVSVGYRLAPEHPYPAGPDDCEAAALWVVKNAQREFGSDVARDRRRVGGRAPLGRHDAPPARPPRPHAVPRREPRLRLLRPRAHAERAALGHAQPDPLDADRRAVRRLVRAARAPRRPRRLAAPRRSRRAPARALQRRHARPAPRRHALHGVALASRRGTRRSSPSTRAASTPSTSSRSRSRRRRTRARSTSWPTRGTPPDGGRRERPAARSSSRTTRGRSSGASR